MKIQNNAQVDDDLHKPNIVFQLLEPHFLGNTFKMHSVANLAYKYHTPLGSTLLTLQELDATQ